MGEKAFVGYEYEEVAVKSGMSSVYADGYENFGWKLENSDFALGKPDSVVMRFKRDRKIRNKPELIRLQRQFNSIVSDIVSLESSKRIKASIVAYIVGIAGMAFMAGSVFSIISGMLVPCIILAIPAFIGWIVPYFLLAELEMPVAGDNDIVVRNLYASICGTDVAVYQYGRNTGAIE